MTGILWFVTDGIFHKQNHFQILTNFNMYDCICLIVYQLIFKPGCVFVTKPLFSISLKDFRCYPA